MGKYGSSPTIPSAEASHGGATAALGVSPCRGRSLRGRAAAGGVPRPGKRLPKNDGKIHHFEWENWKTHYILFLWPF